MRAAMLCRGLGSSPRARILLPRELYTRGEPGGYGLVELEVSNGTTPCGGEVLHVCLKMSRAKRLILHHVAPHRRCRYFAHVSRERPDATPCHTPPPQGVLVQQYPAHLSCNAASPRRISFGDNPLTLERCRED